MTNLSQFYLTIQLILESIFMLIMKKQVPDIETEFNRFVVNSGGRLVSEIVGSSPKFNNADYLFRDVNVISELKCLREDKSHDKRFQQKVQERFDSWIDKGLVPNPGPGTFRLESKYLPLQCTNELYKIYQKPINRIVDKANRQIKQTKKHLNLPEAKGLLLLVNDGNYALELDVLAYAVTQCLGIRYKSINMVVIFTVNMFVHMKGIEKNLLVWMPAERKELEIIDPEFLNRLQVGWMRHLEDITGVEILCAGQIEANELEMIRYNHRFNS